MTSAPLELDYLVETLRNPPADMSLHTVLSHLYHYLPYIKHEHNLRVVFASFLNSPAFFGSSVVFDDAYPVIEAVKFIVDKKLRVSQPTVPHKTFYATLLREIKSFVAFDPVRNCWKALPVLAGIALSNVLRDELYLESNPLEQPYFRQFDSSASQLFGNCLRDTLKYHLPQRDVVELAVVALALTFTGPVTSSLSPPEQAFMIARLVQLMYGPDGHFRRYDAFARALRSEKDLSSLLLSPAVKHANKLSVLLERLLAQLPHDTASHLLVLDSLSQILSFNQTLNFFVQSSPHLDGDPSTLDASDTVMCQLWFFFKTILFSEVLVFQGVMTRFLESKNVGFWGQLFSSLSRESVTEAQYTDIAYQILLCLYFVYFILVFIGQGGFDGYNFVYYVSLELCLKNKTSNSFLTFSRALVENYEVNTHHSVLNRSYVARTKVLFALGLFESYFQQAVIKDTGYVAFIYDVAFDLTENKHLHDSKVTEAGHSVLLAHFSKTKNDAAGIERVLTYFQVLVGQFPSRISAAQLSFAVETLGRKIMSSPVAYEQDLYEKLIERFLHHLHFACMHSTSGVAISRQGNDMFVSASPSPASDAKSTLSQMTGSSTATKVVAVNKHRPFEDTAEVDVLLFGLLAATDHFAVRQMPQTAREGLIVAFLHVVPYLPLHIFETWLNRIWALVLASNSREREFLARKFWFILSENLDFNRCEVAYRWWYETKQHVEHMDLGAKF